jgi:gamma-glutamyl:cysteine ligase YbdK (ATP-grasp superfamily)
VEAERAMLLLRKGARRCPSPFRLERRCSGDPNSCLIYAPVRPELLHAADWRASRHELDAELVDAEVARVISAREMIEKVFTFARPALEEDGDWEEVAVLVREKLEHGNGASRQRRAYERAGRLEDIVDTLIRETAPGGQVRQNRE